jgi:murein DD-endopeptidase MepM/ murein hydrolase activator NlpD
MYKRIKIGALVIAVSLILVPLQTFATSIAEKKNEQAGVNKQLEATEVKVKEKQDNLTATNEKVQSFQTKIDEVQGRIDVLQFNTDKAQKDIESKQNLIVKKEQESLETQNMLGERLRSYYKNDMNSQTLCIILNSESITDLISNMINVSKLMKLDQDLLKEIEAIKISLAEEKVSIQNEMDKLNEEKEQIKIKQQEQVDAQKEFLGEKNKYEAQMKELKVLQNEQQKKYDDLNNYKVDLQNQIDELFINLEKEGNTDSNISKGEGFLTPAGGYISSVYGVRVHPITGANGFHTGIDFAAANQSDILASKSGTVIFAGEQSGYGNIVILDHGGGIQTFYAHCSSILVSKGTTVSRGSTIAKVGSTGNSTGPHLHFEVRVNGKHTDPMNYL